MASPFPLCHEPSSPLCLRKKTNWKNKHYIWGQSLIDKWDLGRKRKSRVWYPSCTLIPPSPSSCTSFLNWCSPMSSPMSFPLAGADAPPPATVHRKNISSVRWLKFSSHRGSHGNTKQEDMETWKKLLRMTINPQNFIAVVAVPHKQFITVTPPRSLTQEQNHCFLILNLRVCPQNSTSLPYSTCWSSCHTASPDTAGVL